MPSEIEFISPMVEQLMRLTEPWRCVVGNEFAVGLALREALNNAVVHGNARDSNKLVEVRCRCDWEKGVSLSVENRGKGFDLRAVPDPLALGRVRAEHGRGIHLMKLMTDEVSFHRVGTEIHIRKGLIRRSGTALTKNHERVSSDATNNLECATAAVGRE